MNENPFVKEMTVKFIEVRREESYQVLDNVSQLEKKETNDIFNFYFKL